MHDLDMVARVNSDLLGEPLHDLVHLQLMVDDPEMVVGINSLALGQCIVAA
jgi:hypothetical protein